MIKSLYRLPSLQKIDKRAKHFLLCCLALFIYCESLEDSKVIAADILIVINNKFVGNFFVDGQPTPAEISKTRLLRCIADHDNIQWIITDTKSIEKSTLESTIQFNIEDDESTLSLEDSIDGKEKYECKLQWLNELYAAIKPLDASDVGTEFATDNVFYVPKMTPLIFSLIERLPLWTGIMAKYFHSDSVIASSSNVEGSFRTIKQIVTEDLNLPVRVDTFLKAHIKSLNGLLSHSMASLPISDESSIAETTVDTTRGEENTPVRHAVKTEKANQFIDISKIKIEGVAGKIDNPPSLFDKNVANIKQCFVKLNKINLDILNGYAIATLDHKYVKYSRS